MRFRKIIQVHKYRYYLTLLLDKYRESYASGKNQIEIGLKQVINNVIFYRDKRQVYCQYPGSPRCRVPAPGQPETWYTVAARVA